ncbi:MAG: YibE/F family protein [Lachnospiraceae bacterium]|nr:YibE/F family protein [Lachnospiraceae bacterium]
MKSGRLADWLRREKFSLLLLVLAAALFVVIRLTVLAPDSSETIQAEDYVEYEKARVVEILTDTTAADDVAEGMYRGEQMLTAEVLSGQYKGKTLLAYNYAGPLYGVPLQKGDGVVLTISTYASGDVRATVFEYNRIPALLIAVGLFFLVTILVGGKRGAKSLVGLVFTVLCLFLLLIPLLLKGAPTLPTVFLTCAFIAVFSFTVLGGLHRKSVCAMLGTLAGTAFAMGFGLLAQGLARINGYRTAEVEPLLQLRQTGVPIGLSGLLVGGIIISALGAVMDVAMSISSALEEVHAANPALSRRDLFRSGMNIGRDMVGTMTNTLILAFLGSGFTLIIYLFSLGLGKYQLLSSAYAAVEVISGIASSIGMILAIPLTALISSVLLGKSNVE